jgi:hypothetical protein
MAQDSLQKMVQNRNTIRRIMAMDSGGQMNKLLENAKTSGRVVYDNDGGVTYNKPVQQDVPTKSSDGSLVVNEETMKAHPKMAKAILEYFFAQVKVNYNCFLQHQCRRLFYFHTIAAFA